jgi:hypothetical protein
MLADASDVLSSAGAMALKEKSTSTAIKRVPTMTTLWF